MSGPRGAIVTGGTGALGRALVRRLLAQGTRVAVPWRNAGEWRSLHLEAGGAPLLGIEASLADAAGAAAFVAEAAGQLGVLDAVGLLAGGWAGGASC
mgnify:CR=1 FL=1